MIFFVVISILLVIDQISKYLIFSKLAEGDTIPIISNFFHITYVQNRGVAFGVMQGKLSIINIVSFAAVSFMIYYVIKSQKKNSKIENIAWIFIIAGAFGNIIDRLTRGFVVDMIDFRGIWSYIFNFADVYINIGVILMIINSFAEERIKKRGGNIK